MFYTRKPAVKLHVTRNLWIRLQIGSIALRIPTAHNSCPHELVHVQNVRDFPQTKLDNWINSPFKRARLPPIFFFQVFAKNGLIKNIFEEEKKFDTRTWFFFCKIVPNWVYFGQGEDFRLTTELSKKVQYSRNQAIKNGLNEVILLM